MVSGDGGTCPWNKPRSFLGQIRSFQLNCMCSSFAILSRWSLGWVGFVPGTIFPRGGVSEKWLCVLCFLLSEDAMGVWKKEGGRKPHERYPSWKQVLDPPFVWYVFHPPRGLLLCFLCTELQDWAHQKLFWSETFSGGCIVWCAFLPPYLESSKIKENKKKQTEPFCTWVVTRLSSFNAFVRSGKTDPVQFELVFKHLFAYKNRLFASSFLLLGIGLL